jgi:hypothetical protein
VPRDRPLHVPVVLGIEELRTVLAQLTDTPRLVVARMAMTGAVNR